MVPKGTANIKQSPTLTQININPNIEGLFISVSITWFTSGFQEKLLGDKKTSENSLKKQMKHEHQSLILWRYLNYQLESKNSYAD